MAKGTPVSVRLRPDLHEKLDAIAAAVDRPRSWVINRAVEAYVADQEWQLAAIASAVKAADAGGPFADHQEIERWLRSWGADHELPPPKCG